MGRVLTYRAGRRSIQVYSGPDLYDSLEDLDLTARSMWISGHLFSVSTTRLAPEVVIAVLQGKTADHPPCDNIGVLTRHVPKPTTRKYLEDFHISND